jgi:membrane protease subunit (stomatin/prohibitin family)
MIKSNIRFDDPENLSVIRCDNDALIWKSPITDFNTGSTVIVSESQKAVFYMNGECSEELGAGIHVLETCDIPFVKRIIEKLTKNKTEFQAELYYINCVEMANLRWGVGHINYKDIKGPVFEMGARGVYNIKAETPRKIIEKINGVQAGITKADLEDRFRKLIASAVNDALVGAMYKKQISIIDVARYRTEISEDVAVKVEELFSDYGIAVTQFIIENIYVDEDDPNYKALLEIEAAEGLQSRQLQLEAQRELTRADIAAGKIDRESAAQARKRQREGYTYQDERRFDVLHTAMENDGTAANVSNQFLDMGIGLGMAGTVGKMFGETLGNVNNSTINGMSGVGMVPPTQNITGTAPGTGGAAKITCKECGKELDSTARFCQYCGAKVEQEKLVVCPSCGANVKDGKFCSMCGGLLHNEITHCPQCNQEVEPGAMFCMSCGHKLR